MSRKKEVPVQFLLPIGGELVNQCCFVSEDELEKEQPAARLAALLEKAAAGELSARALSRNREELLREAISSDRAELLPRLMPQRRMELSGFAALFAFAEDCRSPDSLAWLLAYRGEHYRPEEFEALEQRQLELELGLEEPGERELRKLFRLRYVREGVCLCGLRQTRPAWEIPASIGGKPVVGVDAAAFFAQDPPPRVRRVFPERLPAEAPRGERLLLGRAMEKRGSAEKPLPWRVLRREEDRALVLCERSVAFLPYHPALQEVSWADCALRRWLNEIFLPLSFTEAERARILPAELNTPDNLNYGSPGGPATTDRLFLLSLEEAAELLSDDGARSLGCWWWLRSPGFDGSFAAAVTPDGALMRIGSFVDGEDYAVRPAMWIRTD